MSEERSYLEGNAEVFGKSFPTPEQKMLLEEIRELEKKMIHRKRHMGYTEEENQAFFEKEMFELKERYYFRNLAIADEVREDLEKAKQKHLTELQHHVHEDMLNLERWKLRYQTMSKDQLIDDAQKYLTEGGFSPDQLDVLNASLSQAGVKKIGHGEPVKQQSFSEWIDERHGHEPWFEQNPQLVKDLELYDQDLGFMKILGENDHLYEFNIDRAYLERSDGSE